MKTLKELLYERHQGAEPELDTVRVKFLTRLGVAPLPSPLPAARGEEIGWRERFFLPLRWHLAGLSAAWAVVLLLNHSSEPVIEIAKENIPPAQQLLASLRAHQLEILDLTTGPSAEPIALPPRRSEIAPSTAIG